MPVDTKLHIEVEGQGLVHVHPETNTDQVIDKASGKTISELMNGSMTVAKFPSFERLIFQLIGNLDNPITVAPINGVNYNPDTDATTVHHNGELLYPHEYDFDTSSGFKINLKNGRSLLRGDHLLLTVDRSTMVQVANFNQSKSIEVHKFNATTTTNNQLTINFGDPTFNPATDKTMVFVQSEVLIEGTEYTANAGGTITLTTGYPVGYNVHVIVFRSK